jgi:hypothetical protein
VPASIPAGAGIRRHLRLSAACGARVGAAESFVSFIPLFDRLDRTSTTSSPAELWMCQIVRLIHALDIARRTLEGVARRGSSAGKAGMAAAPCLQASQCAKTQPKTTVRPNVLAVSAVAEGAQRRSAEQG